MIKISEAAHQTGLPPKTIRYYEEIELVLASARSEAGYRFYDDEALRKLAFVKRAREFGFSIEECRGLLKLYSKKDRESRDVKTIAEAHLKAIEEKQKELQKLYNELSQLVSQCPGSSEPQCPILDAFE